MLSVLCWVYFLSGPTKNKKQKAKQSECVCATVVFIEFLYRHIATYLFYAICDTKKPPPEGEINFLRPVVAARLVVYPNTTSRPDSRTRTGSGGGAIR